MEKRLNKSEFIQTLKQDLEARKAVFPFKRFRPNIGQIRALSCWENIDANTGYYPTYNIITGGNGSGKTTLIAAEVLPALCYGIGAINPNRQEQMGLYHHLLDRKKSRANGQLNLSFVAPPSSLQEGGAFVSKIQEWVPQAIFSKMDAFYHHLEINGQHIQLFSSKQDVDQFSGNDRDLVIVDEPVRPELWMEIVGRTRVNGFVMHTVTPLRGCDYLIDILDNKYASWTKISVWDNCAEIEGTNGTLTKHAIEAMIEEWKNYPEELNARVYGDMIKLAGNVFSEFDATVHVLDKLPPDVYVYGYAIDPHLVKEPAVIFFAQNERNQIIVYDEYPHRQWNLINHTNKPLDDICYDLRQYTNGKQFAYTVGDPNMSKTNLPNTAKSIAAEYKQRGFDISTNVNDSEYMGRGEIHKLLKYDPNYEISSTNTPHLFFTKNCTNMISAMKKYRFNSAADTDKNKSADQFVETKYKCFIDCLRYATTSIKDFYHAQNIADAKFRKANQKYYKPQSLGISNLW
jgi:hypothetical protein